MKENKNWPQGRRRIDEILSKLQLLRAEWVCIGISLTQNGWFYMKKCSVILEILIQNISGSHLYSKVAVFSKVPLPNYRFDLDDKRPQREVFF